MAVTGRRPLRVRIEGTNLPGDVFCDYVDVHVGVQCKADAADLVPGGAARADFEFDIDALPGPAGGWDFRGPYVHGKPGERFVYLTWGEHPPGGEFAMFRRAKLHLSCLDAGLIADAAQPGRRLVGRLGLTDGRGGPRCASVRPPEIDWSAEPC